MRDEATASQDYPTLVGELIAERGAADWACIADVALVVADELAGRDPVLALRLLAAGVAGFQARCDRPDLQAAWLLRPPGTTGDARWDVLVAGVARHLACTGGHEIPFWAANVEPLAVEWTPITDARPTPGTWPALDALRVVLDASTFESA